MNIFAENRLHLGKKLKQAWLFCSRFALSLQKIGCISAKSLFENNNYQESIFIINL